MPHRETVLYQENDGVVLITLNRPQALNALNMDMLQRLLGLLDQAQANDSVKALVITGTGDIAFSAGADIEFLNQATPLAVRSFAQMAIAVNHKIETLGKVVIAAITRAALRFLISLCDAAFFLFAIDLLPGFGQSPTPQVSAAPSPTTAAQANASPSSTLHKPRSRNLAL